MLSALQMVELKNFSTIQKIVVSQSQDAQQLQQRFLKFLIFVG